MFTGIIEATGTVADMIESGTNKSFWISAPLHAELKVDQSLSHNGCCLTVEAIENDAYKVTAIQETLLKTNLGSWKKGDTINLERCLQMNGRLDGHFVLGHVDGKGKLLEKKDLDGSWLLTFEYPASFSPLVIEKGSISLNGISLTIFNVTDNQFSVAIIPYTFAHTNLRFLDPGDEVNLEFDMIGKYILRQSKK